MYDDRLRFMAMTDVLPCCFAGGPIPNRGLELGRGGARLRVVRLGDPKVRKARLVMLLTTLDGGEVFVYRDSFVAHLDLGRRLKAVMDVLDAMIRSGVSLDRSLELTVLWKCILRACLVHPITQDHLQLVLAGGIGEFRGVSWELHCRYRGDEAIRGWRNWLREKTLWSFLLVVEARSGAPCSCPLV